jgi:hypothetical protein
VNKQIRGWLENGGSLTGIKLYKKHLWLVILEEHTKSFPTVCVCMQSYLPPQVLLYESFGLFLHANCSEGT